MLFGILSLIAAPVTLPIAGLRFVGDTLVQIANGQIEMDGQPHDDTDQLYVIRVRFDDGEIVEYRFYDYQADAVALEIQERQNALR